MSKITKEKAKQIFIKMGKSDGEKHILQCLYLVDLDFKLAEHWNKILTAFYILTEKQIKDENK
jgi:hypothetical protein